MADTHKLDESYESFKRANIERLADRIGLEYDINTYKSKIIAERLYREGININNYGEYQAYLNKILINSVAPKEEERTFTSSPERDTFRFLRAVLPMFLIGNDKTNWVEEGIFPSS